MRRGRRSLRASGPSRSRSRCRSPAALGRVLAAAVHSGDRRARASQLGDGRLCAGGRGPAGRGRGVVRDRRRVLGRAAVCSRGRRRPVRPHHDGRHAARGYGYRRHAGARPRAGRPRLARGRVIAPASTCARRAKTFGADRSPCRPGSNCVPPTSACSRRWASTPCGCCAGRASPSSRPATNCARPARRWQPGRSTTATDIRCRACCSGSGWRSSTSA